MNNDNEGAWIFISHSLKDWDKVRRIRNILEEKGRKPLLFFLKCLNDDSEIDDLIKREIESRDFFILCDSENAKNSKWVKAEDEFVKSLEKVYEVIDLDDDIETQLGKIGKLLKRSTVFISHSHSDENIAQKFIKSFKDNDYQVFDYNQISPVSVFVNEISKGIDESIEKGFFLLLLSEKSLESKFVKLEIEYAFTKAHSSKSGGNIIPISLIEINKLMTIMPLHLMYLVSNIKIHDFSSGDLQNNINNLISEMKTQEME
jgi:hypothetical protein